MEARDDLVIGGSQPSLAEIRTLGRETEKKRKSRGKMPEIPKEFDGFAIGGHDDGISVSGGLVSSPPPRPDAHLTQCVPSLALLTVMQFLIRVHHDVDEMPACGIPCSMKKSSACAENDS
jgi:hypothetical protein